MATASRVLPRRTILNALSVLGGEAFARLATLAMALIVARQFGPDALGQYGYALALASVLLLVPDFGLHLLTTRELAADPRQLSSTFWSLHWLKIPLVGVVAVFVLLFGELAVRDEGRRALLYILVARALLQTFSLAYMAIFKAFERMHHIALVQLVNASLVVVGAALALELRLGVRAVVSAFLIGQAAETWLAWQILHRHFSPAGQVGWDSRLLRSMLLAAAPIGLTSMLQAVNLRVDLLVLSIFAPNPELGRYQAAAWFMIGTFLVASLLMSVLFPRLSRLLRHLSERGTFFVESLLKHALLVMTLGALVVGSAAPLLLRGLFGTALASADDLLRILAPALPFVFINVILFHVFVAAGRRRAYLGTLIISVAVGLTGGFLLAPRFGASGSAIAALVREFITTLVFLHFLRREQVARKIGNALLKTLLGATAAAVVICGVAYAHVPWTAWPMAWSLLVLGAALGFTGVPNRDQLTLYTDEES